MRRWQADLVLCAIALLWGATFVLIKNELEHIAPVNFVFWRFLIASVALVAISGRRLFGVGGKSSRPAWIAGFWIGLAVGMGYIFQTIGLRHTTASKAGFLTGLYVILVPVFAGVFLKHRLAPRVVLGVLAAFAGLLLLSIEPDWTFAYGDLLVLACAVFFALQVLMIGHFTQGAWRLDPWVLGVAQIVAATLVVLPAVLLLESMNWHYAWRTWGVIAFMGIAATALALVAQSYAQKFTTPTHAALIFTLEPVSAIFFGWWWADDVFTAREFAGCALALVGIWLGAAASVPGSDPGVQPKVQKDAVQEQVVERG